ncbi:MAG TPA: amidase [Gammaproteobacteria bacterium]|nr:amidase [Gammaproteobacteria bacterium]
MQKIAPWLLAVWLLAAACAPREAEVPIEERTIAELQALMADGRLTARALAEHYLDRIERLDRQGPALGSIIEQNDDALAIADALDRERREQGARGPLHGIPVVLKANIDTADGMSTTAGSLALEGHRPAEDAHLVSRLRAAGALILAKTNLSEWAYFRSSRATSGWSSVGGQTRNPYDPVRNPCGSSSGSAVAVSANLAVVAVGTETSGSIVCPAGVNGIVGIKPTLGLVSRSGIIPIAHSQDTAGPMARTVEDAAILLTAMAGPDPDDPITADAPPVADYAADLGRATLAGKRIGVWRTYLGSEEEVEVRAILDSGIEAMRQRGALIVDPAGIDAARLREATLASYVVMNYEFKADLELYLDRSEAPIETLADVIAFNTANADRVMPYFGQDLMEAAQARGPLSDPEYLDALELSKRVSRVLLRTAIDEHGLDAIVAPTNGPAWITDLENGDDFNLSSASLAATAGFPSITVPGGFVDGLPIGLSFIGDEWEDKALIEIAHAFEQATLARRPPTPEAVAQPTEAASD